MRFRTIFLVAAALGAAPAAAQNRTVDANTVTADNVVMADPANATGNAPVNGLTAAPATPPAETAAPVTGDTTRTEARRDRGSFPWGLIGLVGLVGLLGRRRRSD